VLHGCLPHHAGLRLRDRSADWATIAVVGRRAGAVLAALGVYGPSGDPRHTAPLSVGSAGEAAALWLLESDHRAVAVVSREQAGVAWQAIEQAGQASGICCVGQDAAARYALLDRRTGTLAPV
jgi:glycine cleavage system aminomethyltransferase T